MTGIVALALITQCAPHVAPATVQDVIRVESGGDPLAVNINGQGGGRVVAVDLADAVAKARAAIAAGHSVDIGLMQVNSTTGAKLGYTIEQLFDPCKNLQAGAAVLTHAYQSAASTQGAGQGALRSALSAYNTGDFTRGFTNGYVGRYYGGSVQPYTVRTASPYAAQSTIFIRQETPHEQGTTTANPAAARDTAALEQP